MTRLDDGRWTGAVTSVEDPPVLVSSSARFSDRHEAGRKLVPLLRRFAGEHPVVVGIPRGGVPVAAEVAWGLDAPLEVVVVRKIGAPQNPEFAIGALAEDGVYLLDQHTVRSLNLPTPALRAVVARARRELEERTRRYRGERASIDLTGRTAILVDDGLATGNSAAAAVASLREQGATRVILAVPVAAPESARALRERADEVVCVEEPAELWAVGAWYEDFQPTTDREVARLLAGPGDQAISSRAAPDAGPRRRNVFVRAYSGVELEGELVVPEDARGMVTFAHGSGSSRLSDRNRAVARSLNEAGLATLLFDLLSASEAADRANVFDIHMLTG